MLVCAPATLAVAGSASAQLAPQPPQQAAAIVRSGVVWFDDGPIVLRGFGPSSTALGDITSPRLVQMASSASAVALVEEDARAAEGGERLSDTFVGGVPPAPLRAIAQPTPVSGGRCGGWQPAAEALADFVVAGEDLVTSGRGACPAGAAATRQPLFVRDLRKGRWRVLRWLAGDSPPMLAAEGDMLAVGVQLSASAMEVFVIDLRDGHTEARFILPDGYLAWAAPNRLVLAAPEESRELNEDHFPLGPRLYLGGATYSSGAGSGPFQLLLYSTKGRRIAQLGSSREPPLVSDMHIVSDEYDDGDEVISIRGALGGAAVPVVGFDGSGRSLITLAFRWPTLAVVETTRAALQPNEVTCESGLYGPASEPLLALFDLATSEPFLAPPASSSLPTDCPIAPVGAAVP